MRHKYSLWLGALCVLAAPAWAGTVSATSSITNGNLTFSNFTVSTVGGTNAATSINGNTFGANVTNLSGGVPDATTLDVATVGDGIQFSSTSDVSSGTCPGSPATLCVQGKNQSLMVTITYLVTAASGTFTSTDLFGTLHSHANSTTAIAYLDTCGTGVTIACSSTPTGVASLGQLNGTNVSLSGPLVSNTFGATSKIWVRETIYLTTSNGSGSDAEFFAQGATTPEPATLGMVGLALTGLGVLRLRRKKS